VIRTGLAATVLAAAACGHSAPVRGDGRTLEQRLAASSSVPLPAESVMPIRIRTYEGSGEAAHPDVVFFTDGWRGWRYWMAVTPLPYGNGQAAERSENPSIYVSNNGRYWTMPSGLVNPVARPHPDRALSDPDLYFDSAGNALSLAYREAGLPGDAILRVTSRDGIRWTAPETLFVGAANSSLSPSVVPLPTPQLWHVDAGPEGCSSQGTVVRRRSLSNRGVWSASVGTMFRVPGYIVWHEDVQYVRARREYWALATAYKTGGACLDTDLFLATSTDGRHWRTYPSPVLRRGDSPEFTRSVYRSTSVYDPQTDSVTLWFSGISDRDVRHWHLAVARYSRASLMKRVSGH
jgi:hypothetical protein